MICMRRPATLLSVLPLGLSALALPALALPPVAGAGTTVAAEAAPPGRPNIVVVMADDLGWADLQGGRASGGTGNPYVDTPALDRLAEEGAAFDNAYAATNCAPTRAAMLTGLWAPRPGNNVYQVDDLNRGGPDRPLVGPPQGLPDGRDAVPTSSTTFAETLSGAGYDTGYVGKFHVTGTPGDITAGHGFDENLGGTAAGHPGQYHATDQAFHNNVGPALDRWAGDYTQDYVDTQLEPYSHGVDRAALDALVGTDKHVSDALGDASLDFVDRHAGSPFLLMTSAYAVHTPVGRQQARDDLLAKYDARPPVAGHPADPSYAALLEGLDQSVARIVDHLEETPDPRNPGHPLADNTVVLFTSDNGGLARYADNGPLAGQKGELREGGIRVPLIAWSGSPDLVDGGSVNHTPVSSQDYHPTLASLAEATPPAVDGRDLSALYADRDAELDRDALYWHLPGYLVEGGRDQRPESVIRSGRWKLVYSYERRDAALYDLRSDLGETRDLADLRPARVQALGAKLQRWLDELDAPLATLAEDEAPVRFTFTGTAYADGATTRHRRDQLVVEPGEEVPMLVPATG